MGFILPDDDGPVGEISPGPTGITQSTPVAVPAPSTAAYLVLSANPTLTLERVLTAGANITLTDGGAGGALTIAASGGGGSGNSVTVTVDFGSSFSHFASVVVTGQTWVASGSEIVATVLSASGKGMEDAVLGFSASVSDLVAGTGFTLNVYAPNKAKGTYTFSCVGV